MSIMFYGIAVRIIILSILDWDSFLFPLWSRAALGVPAWLAGYLLGFWAVLSLGLARTSGQASEI